MARARGRQTSGLRQAWEATASPDQEDVLSQRTGQHSVLDPSVVPRDPSAPGYPASSWEERASSAQPWSVGPPGGGRSRRWVPQARLPGECPSPHPAAGSGDSLGLSCFSSRPAIVGIWSAFVGPCSGRRKVLLKAGLLCSHGRTHGIPTQGMCLVYLADVLPEQMGKGNDSRSHFCLHCTLAHPSFSRLLSLGQQVPATAHGEAATARPPRFSFFL